MKKCGECDNMHPEGRVVNRCNNCLDLYRFYRALTDIVEVVHSTDYTPARAIDRVYYLARMAIDRSTRANQED